MSKFAATVYRERFKTLNLLGAQMACWCCSPFQTLPADQ
jgi:hypothetical protein